MHNSGWESVWIIRGSGEYVAEGEPPSESVVGCELKPANRLVSTCTGRRLLVRACNLGGEATKVMLRLQGRRTGSD
jgi:hypothetical protein